METTFLIAAASFTLAPPNLNTFMRVIVFEIGRKSTMDLRLILRTFTASKYYI
jgi:hypothetical protein